MSRRLPSPPPRPGRQAGVVLLAFLLLALTGTAFLLFRAIDTATRDGANRAQTYRALQEARQALLGYAAGRPGDAGYLPCPDTAYNGPPFDPVGSANTPCAALGVPSLGLFPWGTLETGDVRDGSGTALWYAVSGNHKINPATVPLNSDVAGTLSVDGAGDVVAVLLAPGAALPGQARAPNSYDVTQYLEGDNQTVDDNSFANVAGSNDVVMAITRQELIDAVERRVAGEVAKALNDYAAAYGGYPWLSGFAQPDLASFKSTAGVREGQLPFHDTGDPGPGINENPFASTLNVTWSLSNADIVTVADNDPFNDVPAACITDSDCLDPDFGSLAINSAAANCTWWDPDPAVPPQARDYARCNASISFSVSKPYPPPGPAAPVAGQLTRTYTITFSFDDTTVDGADILAPDAVNTRSRTLTTGAPADFDPVDDDYQIAVDIRQEHVDDLGLYPIRTDQVTVTADADTTGTFTSARIAYDLDVDAGELPAWLIRGDWHHLIYIAYSNADSPGGAGSCDVSGPCLSLRVQRPAPAGPLDLDNQRGIVLLAGQDLTGARPSASLADYFENENDQNATPNDVFTAAPVSLVFNDRIRSLGTSP